MANDMDLFFKPIVLVTGFGPFANHPVNASWEGVKLLDKDEIEKKHNVELVLLEIPVTYENVDEFIPALWETHTPKLMVHVGVSRLAKCLTLETQANRKGYQRKDYFDKCPADHTCPAEGAVRLHTKLDVERICKEINNQNPAEGSISAVASKDAGRYLCEYTYYTSLSVDSARTLFVHVPDLHLCAPNQVAQGLRQVLELCLQQLDELEPPQPLAHAMEKASLQDGDNHV